MKGIVFTEFLEMVEDTFSPAVADEMISASNLESNGFYTAVGTYDHQEMVEMVTQLSEMTGVPIGDLLEKYGVYLFSKLIEGYPGFLEGIDNAFDFLKTIGSYIHCFHRYHCRCRCRFWRRPDRRKKCQVSFDWVRLPKPR